MNWDSITVARVNSWSNSLHITTCSGEQDSNLMIPETKGEIQLLLLNSLHWRSSTHQKCDTAFVFSPATGTCYGLWHSPSDSGNKPACVVLKYGFFKGKDSLLNAKVYAIRHIEKSTLCSLQSWKGKSILYLRRNWCSQSCVSDNSCGVISQFDLIYINRFYRFLPLYSVL